MSRGRNVPFKGQNRKFKTNLRHDGSTTDGGFPKSINGVDYHGEKKHIARDVISSILICVFLSFLLKIFIDMGLGNRVWDVITGQIPWSEGKVSFLIFSVLVVIIVGLIVTTIIVSIRFHIKCNKVFNLESEE